MGVLEKILFFRMKIVVQCNINILISLNDIFYITVFK